MSEPTLYLLDTNVISDMMRNPSGRAARNAIEKARQNPAHRMITSVIVQCELLFGMRRRSSPRWQQQYDLAMSGVEVLPLEPDVSSTYADIRTQLEATGTPIGPHDTLIAAHALALGAVLVTDNEAEFRRVPGLQVDNWLRPA